MSPLTHLGELLGSLTCNLPPLTPTAACVPATHRVWPARIYRRPSRNTTTVRFGMCTGMFPPVHAFFTAMYSSSCYAILRHPSSLCPSLSLWLSPTPSDPPSFSSRYPTLLSSTTHMSWFITQHRCSLTTSPTGSSFTPKLSSKQSPLASATTDPGHTQQCKS